MTIGVTVSQEKSTIVRSFRRPIREQLAFAGLATLSRVAPGLAARLAERAFLTPPRHRAPAREREILVRARPGSVRVAGRRITTWVWGDGPRVLLVHGWGGRGGQLGAFVPALVTRGLSVVTFDAPAHGASEGRIVTIPEMAAAVRGVVDAVGLVRGIVAHSGGGAVSAWAIRRMLLAGFVDLPEAMVLVAPAADFRAYFVRFVEACGLSGPAQRRLERRLEARVGVPPEAFNLAGLAEDLPLAALIFHDREDAEVPWSDGAAVAAAWPDAELVATSGLGHRRILRDPAVVLRAAEFLAGRLASSADPAAGSSVAAALC